MDSIATWGIFSIISGNIILPSEYVNSTECGLLVTTNEFSGHIHEIIFIPTVNSAVGRLISISIVAV